MQTGSLFPRQLGGRLPRCRLRNGFAQAFPIAGDDQDLFSAARGGDVEQFLLHTVSGDNHRIDRLALAPVGGHGISVRELFEVGRQYATVAQMNPVARVHM